MNWTTEKPTQPGYYWCRQQLTSSIVQLQGNETELFLFSFETRTVIRVHDEIENGDAQWYGPLAPPSFEKEQP